MGKNSNLSGTNTSSYSQALYELASEANSLNEIENQANGLIKLIIDSKDFTEVLKDPTNKESDLLNVVNAISKNFGLNSLLNKLLIFLISKRRLFYLDKILRDFVSVCSKKRGEIQARLSTAKELDKNSIEKIKDELTKNFGSEVKLNFKHDPSLIGGLVIQVGSLMIDTSIKNRLAKYKKAMMEN